MQRRIEEPDRHREPSHRFEDALEVLLLKRQQLGQRIAPLALVAEAMIISRTTRKPVFDR